MLMTFTRKLMRCAVVAALGTAVAPPSARAEQALTPWRHGVVEAKSPSSQAALRKVQDAFNAWREESGRALCELSSILAKSVD